MRATSFFSIATLAASAFAAPLVGNLPVVGDVTGTLPVNEVTGDVTPVVNDAVNNVDDVTNVVPVKDVTSNLPVVEDVTDKVKVATIVDTTTGVTDRIPVINEAAEKLPLDTTASTVDHVVENVPVVDDVVKRTDIDAYGLIDLLDNLLKSVTEQTASINETIAAVKADKVTKDVADKIVFAKLTEVLCVATEVVGKCTGLVKITVDKVELHKIVSLIVCIIAEILATVKHIIAVLGLRAHIAAIVKSIFALVANLLFTVTAIVADIAPFVFANVSPILNGVGATPIAQLLTPLTGLVSKLPLPI